MKPDKNRRPDTLLGHIGRNPKEHSGTVNPPVYHASTIVYDTVDSLLGDTKPLRQGVTQYGRAGTPTTFALEDAVSRLEGGAGAIAMPSGLAAVAGALLSLVKQGDHILVTDSAYDPTRTVCRKILKDYGVEAEFYDPLLGGKIESLFRPETALVFTESPGSLTFEVQDIPAIAQVARQQGALVVTDNTWATPLFCRPFDLGADVIIHAATKYIGGHADAMLGLIVARDESLYSKIRLRTQGLGYSVGPDDIYLGLRGLRSLAARLERHQATALALAQWLRERDEVEKVLYPALPGDPGHELWQRDFSGASGLMGLVLKPVSDGAVAAMLDGMELFAMGYSWGGYESLLIPTFPGRARAVTTWPDPGPTLRLHVGLENLADLIEDLEAGFARLRNFAATTAAT